MAGLRLTVEDDGERYEAKIELDGDLETQCEMLALAAETIALTHVRSHQEAELRKMRN